MTSAPRPPAPPGRPINAVFPGAMPRSATPVPAGLPPRQSRDGSARPALALAVLTLLATPDAGSAAGDTAQAASPAIGESPAPGSDSAVSLRSPARAKRGGTDQAIGSPRAACLAAARRSEAAHGIPQGLLVAIALAESGLHAFAMNIGGQSHFPSNTEEARRIYRAARPGQAVMAGCVQVNASVHARNSDWPLDPWHATEWGAGLLRSHYEKTGNWTDAIRRWNGGGASGNRLACRVQAKLQVTNPGSDVLSSARCAGNTRERRNGEALLEIAESAQ